MPSLDPRALRPAVPARLLNSTPPGEVVRPHVIYRQRNRAGYRCSIPGVAHRRGLRPVEIDMDYWKSFVHERLAPAMGDAGCLSVFGRKGVQHRLFAEHLTAEYRVCTEDNIYNLCLLMIHNGHVPGLSHNLPYAFKPR